MVRKIKNDAGNSDNDDLVIRVLTTGIEVICKPIAAAIERYEASIRNEIDWPEKPQRIITDVAGSEMLEPITQKYVDSGKASDDEIKAWNEYSIKRTIAENEYKVNWAITMMRVVATRGIELVDKTLIDDWTKDADWLGIKLPEDANERAVHFFQANIIGNTLKDLQTIIIGIFEATGYDTGRLSQLEDSFRGNNPMGASREGADASTDS